MFVVSALSTCDPGNVHTAIAAAKNAKIRVSVVSVAAEMVGRNYTVYYTYVTSFVREPGATENQSLHFPLTVSRV